MEEKDLTKIYLMIGSFFVEEGKVAIIASAHRDRDKAEKELVDIQIQFPEVTLQLVETTLQD